MYTPLKRGNLPVVQYNPVNCSKCLSYLNPYCAVDFASKFWTCPFCSQKNSFPPNYAGMDPQHLVSELFPENTTIEYRTPISTNAVPPVFLFVVDTAMKHQDEILHLKKALLQALQAIPSNCFVGLITYGANVQVYELSYPHCRRCIVFSGETEVTPAGVQTLLGLHPVKPGTSHAAQLNNKYILPLESILENLTSIVEELQIDPQQFKKGEERKACATGVALSVALAIMESIFPKIGGRIINLSAGPCTVGPGVVVGRDLSEPIRSHYHLRKEEAKYVTAAIAYYNKLAARAVAQGHAVDIFSASLDQTGLLEMHPLANNTGGVLVSTESFIHEIVKQSLRKLFQKDDDGHLSMKFNGTIEVIQSKELKVCGAIGHLQSLGKKNAYVSETAMGIGGTNAWKMCTMDPNTSYAFYFEVVNAHNNIIPADNYGLVQFRTNYIHPSGERVQRVTTIAKTWSPPSAGLNALLPGFDQEACAALIARYAVFKAENEEAQPIKFIDRHLIQFIHAFGSYTKDAPESLKYPPQIAIYPEFMFHLRRGNLIQIFGTSPDETAYYRHYLLRESVSSCLIMIQPALDSYSFDVDEPQPVLLSLSSVLPDKILLLDTFFHVVVFSGETIAAWRKAGYQDQEGYENFKQLLEVPVQDATMILMNRFPMPMYVVCDQGSSQARFLLAVLDPGKTGATLSSPNAVGPAATTSQEIYSDDVPLSVFMEHLKKKVVSYEG
uniref:Protein transport protein SEC23 n=1 Tax=Arcella intermedia TaxID=1963864 RepID=A0A6B2KYA0_9EUKA